MSQQTAVEKVKSLLLGKQNLYKWKLGECCHWGWKVGEDREGIMDDRLQITDDRNNDNQRGGQTCSFAVGGSPPTYTRRACLVA